MSGERVGRCNWTVVSATRLADHWATRLEFLPPRVALCALPPPPHVGQFVALAALFFCVRTVCPICDCCCFRFCRRS